MFKNKNLPISLKTFLSLNLVWKVLKNILTLKTCLPLKSFKKKYSCVQGSSTQLWRTTRRRPSTHSPTPLLVLLNKTQRQGEDIFFILLLVKPGFIPCSTVWLFWFRPMKIAVICAFWPTLIFITPINYIWATSQNFDNVDLWMN